MQNNHETRDAKILIYTRHDSSHMPIEVTDKASLERAFQRMSQETPAYTGPILYRYSRDIPKELLILLYARFNTAIGDFRCQLLGLEPNMKSIATQMATIGQVVDSHRYRCYCAQCEATPATPCGRACIALKIASFRVNDETKGLARSQTTFLQPMSELAPVSDETPQRPNIEQHKNKDIVFTYTNAASRSELSFLIVASDLLCIFQDGRWHILAGNMGQSAEVLPSVPEYFLAEVKHVCAEWRLLIDNCKRFLSIANQEVLNEDVESEIDQTLLKKLFKTAQIFEFLREFHRSQGEGLKELFALIGDGKGDWDNEVHKDTVTQLLSSFKQIGHEISQGLVKESSNLIERTHNILSIDEAFRSRVQNASIKRLSWITFIFLPLLFVASLYGMNVDLLKDNPRWITYFYIAVPLLLCVLFSVRLLKVGQKCGRQLVEPVKHLQGMFRGGPKAILAWARGLILKLKRHRRPNPSQDLEMGRDTAIFWDTSLEEAAFRNGWYEVLISRVKPLNQEMRAHLLKGVLPRVVEEIGGHGDRDAASRLLWFIVKIADQAHGDPPKWWVNMRRDLDDLLARALVIAVKAEHTVLVCRILQHTSNSQNSLQNHRWSGWTVLQLATKTGQTEIVKLLLEHGADVNAGPVRESGRTALQAASEGGHLEVVKILLEHKAGVNAGPAGDMGKTALQAASGGGHLEVVKLLLEHKADVNATPVWGGGRTALQAASEGGHLEVIKLLLEHEADVNAGPVWESGRTALQAASEGGHLEVVKLLLEHEADVNAEPARNCGRTALQAASGGGHLEVVKLLLEHKVDVNAGPVWRSRRTALQAASEGGHLEVVKLLLEHEADVNAGPAGNRGRTALQAASGGGHLEVVKLLLEHKADVNAGPARNHGSAALQAASGGGHLEVVKLLLEHEADVNAGSAEHGGGTALQAASQEGHFEVVKLLLEHKAEVNTGPAEDGEWTALQAASQGGHFEVVKLLLEYKADVNARPVWGGGRTALQAASEGGHLELVKILLEHGADVNAGPAEHCGRTALQAASGGGNLEVAKLLLKHKADVNAGPARRDGRTALQAASGGGHLEVVKLLLEHGAVVNAGPAEYGGRAALQAASEGGSLEVTKLLLEHKADVNAGLAAHSGRTALQAASGGGHLEVVKLLLKHKADINADPAMINGETALQAASTGQHREIDRLLRAHL